MKIPKRPPQFEELLREAQQGQNTGAILQASLAARGDGKYHHWDRLKYHNPPAGLTHRQWWLSLKLARLGMSKLLPLFDLEGQPFLFCLPDPVPERLHHIDQDAAGQIRMSDEKFSNSGAVDRYILRSLVEEAITSSQLEGAATTRLVAKEMIRTARAPMDNDERMILNNYLAIQYIRDLKDHPLTMDMLLELHRRITAGTLKNPSLEGRLRKSDENVEVADLYNTVFHTAPPAEQLPRRMEAMLDFANGKTPDYFLHPVIRAIILHFWMAYDHPFVDGNGRCARSLFYWSMLRQGYWLCEYLSISSIIRKGRSKYGKAFLYVETDANDLTYFILYHLDIIRRAIGELHEYIAHKADQVHRVEKLLKSSASFNQRQLALLSHALRHADAQYTIRSHQTSHNVVYQTAKSDLYNLRDRGLLLMRKAGRAFIFTPVKELEKALERIE